MNRVRFKETYTGHLIILGFFAGFAFSINFSISFAQSFYALALLALSIGHFVKVNSSKPLSTRHSLSALKPVLYIFLAWFIWRLFHVIISDYPLQELDDMREVWLLLIVPVVFITVHTKRDLYFLLWAVVAGGVFTSTVQLFSQFSGSVESADRTVKVFSIHHLTYTGTMGISIILSLGLAIRAYLEGRKIQTVLAGLGTFIMLFSFWSVKSRGGYIALAIALGMIVVFLLRRKVFLVLPFFLILPGLVYQNSRQVQDMVTEAFPQGLSRDNRFTTVNQRIDLWLAGFSIYTEYPLTGTGNGDYKEIYQKHKVPGAKMNADSGSHMHNDFLNTLVLFGGIGLSIFLAIYFLPLIDYMKIFFLIKTINSYDSLRVEYIHLTVNIAVIILMTVLGLSQCHFTDEEVQMAFWLGYAVIFRQFLFLSDKKLSNDEF